jgi:hypothetical protein
VIHDEMALAALLDGELDPTEQAAWDEHLLDCDECWSALDQARRGRALAAALHDQVPSTTRGRIVAAIGQPTTSRAPSRRRRTVLTVATGTIAVLLAVVTFAGYRSSAGDPHDPQAVATVLHLATHQSEQPPAPRDGVTISRLQVQGRDIVVAHSDQPFAMPDGAIALGDTDASPWVARRGDVSLLCFASPAHVLLAGQASPDALKDIARSLGISPT